MSALFRLSSLGFIGAGKIVEVLAKGFIASGVLRVNELWASAPKDKDVDWIRHLGGQATTDNAEILRQNAIIFLAVKPQVLPKVLSEIKSQITRDHLLISVAAGIRLSSIESSIPMPARLARIMPNTPIMYREGVTAFATGSHILREDLETIYKLMSSVGHCVQVKEDMMDIVTGFTGAGPAYVYTFIEALADGAVRGGIPRDEAMTMATQTVLGAAKMVKETGMHTGELRDNVCSAGGASIVGVQGLEEGGLRGTVMRSVASATERSKELGEILKEQVR